MEIQSGSTWTRKTYAQTLTTPTPKPRHVVLEALLVIETLVPEAPVNTQLLLAGSEETWPSLLAFTSSGSAFSKPVNCCGKVWKTMGLLKKVDISPNCRKKY